MRCRPATSRRCCKSCAESGELSRRCPRSLRQSPMDNPLLDPIWVKAVLKALILPPTGLLLVALLGLSLYRRFPRTGRTMAWGGVLLLFALSIPAVSSLLMRGLESGPPFDIARAADAQAIVIIGGGARRNAAEYGGDALGELSLERVRYGAVIARLTHLP